MKVSFFLIFTLVLVAIISFTPEAEAATKRVGRRVMHQAIKRRPATSRAAASSYRRAPKSPSRNYRKQNRMSSAAAATASAAHYRKAVRAGRKAFQKLRKGRKQQQPLRRRASRKSSLRATRTRVSSPNRYTASAGRRVKSSSRSRYSGNNRYQGRRRGRQEGEITEEEEAELEEVEDEMLENALTGEEMPENAIEAEMVLEAMENAVTDPVKREDADENGDGVPDWCNPIKPMGAWLNFRKMKVWCADRGFTKFGPYGGVPMTDAGVEANGDADADVETDPADEMDTEGDDEDAL